MLGLLIYIQRILTKCHSKIIECKYLPSFLKSALHCQEEIQKKNSVPLLFSTKWEGFFPVFSREFVWLVHFSILPNCIGLLAPLLIFLLSDLIYDPGQSFVSTGICLLTTATVLLSRVRVEQNWWFLSSSGCLSNINKWALKWVHFSIRHCH